jgi:F-type H+-transporting ATPase subunit epsilon
MLDPTELRLYKSESDVVSFAQAEGYIQVAGNQVLVLVEEAIPPDDLDVSKLQDRLSEAEKELSEAGEDDAERRRVAERDKRRLEQFIAIAENR